MPDARAARVAKGLGDSWVVNITPGGTIRIVQRTKQTNREIPKSIGPSNPAFVAAREPQEVGVKKASREADSGPEVYSFEPSENFVDIGHADPKDGRRGISARSRIHHRHHPLAQVLRPPSDQRRKGITNLAPLESSGDSINNEAALEWKLPVFEVQHANVDLLKRSKEFTQPGIYLRPIVFDELDPKEMRCFRYF
jgi:hypothetical protein